MSFNKETGMYEGYIYKIYNDVNDKLYIGQTITTLSIRFNQHKGDAKRGNNDHNLLHRAMIKYGIEHFHIEQIYNYKSINKRNLIELLNEKERYYISLFNSVRPNGYNISPGGNNKNPSSYIGVDVYDLNCNYIASCENVYIASAITGVHVDAIRQCYLKKNQKSGQYIFVKSGDKPNIPSVIIKKVEQYNLDYSLCLHTYENAKIASEETGIPHSNIINCCNGKRYATTGGYRWKYEGEDIPINHISPQKVPVDMYTKQLKYIKSFDSIESAADEVGISQSCISLVILNKNKTAGGYIWRYHGEDISSYKFGIQPEKRNKPINVYDVDFNFIGTYNSLGILSKELNIPKGSISKFLKANLLYKDKYYFQYYE